MLRGRVRRAAPLVALAAVAVALAIVTVVPAQDGLPLDPRSTAPDGTAALAAVLARLEVDVRVAGDVGDVPGTAAGAGDVVLVLRDPADDAWRAAIEASADAGARVVVTDAGSPLAPEVTQTFVLPSPAPQCRISALSDVSHITGTGGVGFTVPPDAVGCFPLDDDTAWLVVRDRGAGTVVVAGAPGFLTNSAIDDADNALLAAALLAPPDAATVTIVGPEVALLAAAGEETLVDLVPRRVRLALLQLLIALLVAVAWRWRRLGRPVEEPLPVALRGSALVTATGELLDHAAAYADAASTLSEGLRADLARRAGLPPGAPASQVARAAAPLVRRPADELQQILTPGHVPGPDELVMHARRVAEVRAAGGVTGAAAGGFAGTRSAGQDGNSRPDDDRSAARASAGDHR